MPEQIQTRTEYARSIEDAEKYRALDTLKELGLLVPVADIETFHGRVGSSEETHEWAVDPSFANGSNDSGNSNVNKRATLYTSNEDVADEFAAERGHEVVISRYHKFFRDKVRSYTLEERQAWVDRENRGEQAWWDRISEDMRKFHGSPTVYTLDNIDKQIYSEADRLETLTPDDEKEAVWENAKKGIKKEMHEITTADKDATVLDINFDRTELTPEERQQYRQALKALVLPITTGSPVSFNDRGAVQPFAETVTRHKMGYISTDKVPELATEADINEPVALQLASAYNTRLVAMSHPAYLVNRLLRNRADIITDKFEINGEPQEIPINLEYVQKYLREAHIVGAKQLVDSATVGRAITTVAFFDLEKTTTVKDLETERQATWQKLGNMATAFSKLVKPEVHQDSPLLRLLENPYAKPSKLVNAAKRVEGYETIFEGDAGNWEGYTLAEHTETVLRNFDENYADKLPVEMLAPMRLAILTHDIGKSVAVAHGEKHKQKEYNAVQATDFLAKLGVDDTLKDLLLAVIGDGQELAYQIEVRGDGELAEKEMRSLATRNLRQFLGSEKITQNQIDGFTEMCSILQVCDGGAYTSMAVTRKGGMNGHHRNAPYFNESFANPVGLGRRDIRLRKKSPQSVSPTRIIRKSRKNS